MAGVEYQVTKVDPTDPETKGMVYQVHKVTEEVAATMGGKVYRARIIKDPTEPTVAGKVYQIVLIEDPDDPSVKGKVYNAILTGDSEVVVVGPAVSPLSLPDAIADSLSYVKAFGGTEQRNIPAEYTQVNYVTNTAQTMINTGVRFDFSKNYEIELKASGVTGSWYILQARESSGSPISGISGSSTGNVIGVNFDGTYVAASQISRVFGHIYYVKGTINNGNMTLYVKDETAGTEETVTGTYTPRTGQSVDICLFGNIAENYVAINSDVYFARIKENDTVVMDYVPARQSATAGFYDKVSGTFKTASNLVADGNTVPTPDTPIDIVSNNGVLKVDTYGLPSGYTKLEYIESTGTQYIDTGVKFEYGEKIETKINSLNYSTGAMNIYGTRGGANNRAYLMLFQGRFNFGYGPDFLVQGDITLNTDYTLEITTDNSYNCKLYINAVLAVGKTVSGITSTYNYWLFTGNQAGSSQYPASIRMYYWRKTNSNGTLVRNFIPAKRNSDNVVGMYDLVSGQFFTNAGTGTFTAGPTIVPTIYADGTVETINVHGKNLFNKNNLPERIYAYFANSGTSWLYASSGYSLRFPCLPNTTYTARYNGNSTQVVLSFASTSNDTVPTSGQTNVTVTQAIRQNSPTIDTPITLTTGASDKWLIVQYNAVDPQNTDMANNLQIELGSTATTYEPYYNGGTATAEMLLKVGTYQDVQSIIDGIVTRNVGVKVFDGTENWYYTATNKFSIYLADGRAEDNQNSAYCSHFAYVKSATFPTTDMCFSLNRSGAQCRFSLYYTAYTSADDFKQFLADQYAAGTPVMVIYPLATATTESVTGQTLQVQEGNNILEITQASLDNLELECQYEKEGV